MFDFSDVKEDQDNAGGRDSTAGAADERKNVKASSSEKEVDESIFFFSLNVFWLLFECTVYQFLI